MTSRCIENLPFSTAVRQAIEPGRQPRNPMEIREAYVAAYEAAKAGADHIVVTAAASRTGIPVAIPLSGKAVALGERALKDQYKPKNQHISGADRVLTKSDVQPGVPGAKARRQVQLEPYSQTLAEAAGRCWAPLEQRTLPLTEGLTVTGQIPEPHESDEGDALYDLCLDVLDELSPETRRKIAKLMLGF